MSLNYYRDDIIKTYNHPIINGLNITIRNKEMRFGNEIIIAYNFNKLISIKASYRIYLNDKNLYFHVENIITNLDQIDINYIHGIFNTEEEILKFLDKYLIKLI